MYFPASRIVLFFVSPKKFALVLESIIENELIVILYEDVPCENNLFCFLHFCIVLANVCSCLLLIFRDVTGSVEAKRRVSSSSV